MSLAEICENAKMGREYALLGNYDTALVYYQGVLQQIQKLITQIRETDRKQKWQQVCYSTVDNHCGNSWSEKLEKVCIKLCISSTYTVENCIYL